MAFEHNYCSLREEFGDYEIEVAEILLGLPRLIAISNYGSRLPFSWGGKRRRSEEANLGPKDAVHSPLTSVSPSPSPIFSGPVGFAFTTPPSPPPPAAASKPEEPITVKAEPVTSPATPLSFSPSESDERPKRFKRKVSTNQTTENLLKIINQITESNELLRGEIKKVRQYYRQLKVKNSSLKARKQELSMGVIKREDQLNLSGKNLGQTTVKCPPVVDDQAHVPLLTPGITVYLQQQQEQQQPPLIMDRDAKNQEISWNYPNPFGRRVSLFQSTTTSASENMGPRSIPDLNLTLAEPAWMDSEQVFVDDKSSAAKRVISDNKVITVESVNKAMAAEARKRRMLICKNKSSKSSSKSRFPLK